MTELKFQEEEYWKNYMENWYGTDLIDKWYEYAEEKWILSNDKELHIEVYKAPNTNGKTCIFSHGIAGYARLLLPFVIPLYERGYNFIVPDLKGYGYNKGRRGDFEWNIHVENLRDCVLYAKKIFDGKIILGGGSMGGPLAYAAGARYGNINALACWCLFDFQDKELIKKETPLGRWNYVILPLIDKMRFLIGKMRIRTQRLISYEHLTEESILDLIEQDPHSGIYLTINAAVSLLTQSKFDTPFEDWDLPTLVLHPGADKMIPAKYSRRVFEKLGCEKKRYIEVEGAIHFPVERQYYDIWTSEFDEFFKDL
ncbi:MAG: alpha/beta fold hydrolase [Candidatus Lokiarchaeota archaeon]|nr:alpha/beta fold hydrolase [Candidatus Lokiarchaeota archaeon]